MRSGFESGGAHVDLGHRIAQWDAEAASFDEAADHGLRDPGVRAAWRGLLGGVLPPAPATVADLGCGTGTLARLLAEEGHAVDGLDFSPRMVELARAKTAGQSDVRIVQGDAFDPPLEDRHYHAVLSRHVLWAMPDPAVALTRWAGLLRPGGWLVLVEGDWSTGAGLPAAVTVDLVERAGLVPELTLLDDPRFWGRTIDDVRYLVIARG